MNIEIVHRVFQKMLMECTRLFAQLKNIFVQLKNCSCNSKMFTSLQYVHDFYKNVHMFQEMFMGM